MQQHQHSAAGGGGGTIIWSNLGLLMHPLLHLLTRSPLDPRLVQFQRCTLVAPSVGKPAEQAGLQARLKPTSLVER